MAIEQYPVIKFNPRSIYRKRVNIPQRRATIGLPEKAAAAGAPLAFRQIEAPIQETGPEAMSITDGEASTQPKMITETQQPIQNRGSSARYMIQGGGPRIDLSFLVPERANPNYDPHKAIGGENVPYMESKGVGGFFRRLLGDESNRMNIEAQQAQGAEWRDKALRDEERMAKREDLEHEVGVRTEAERGLKKEERAFTAEQNKALREFNAAESALDRALKLGEGTADRSTRIEIARADRDAAAARLNKELEFRSVESQADRAARSAEGEANRALTAAHYDLQREGQASEIQYKQRPRFERLGDNVYTNEKGEIFEYSPGMPDLKTGKPMPGGFRKVPTPGVMAPRGAGGGGNMQVDRETGEPISAAVTPPRSAMPSTIDNKTTTEAPEQTSEPRYSIWTGRYPGQPEPPLGRLNFETTREFLGPLGESISGAADRFSKPIPKRDLTDPEMLYNPDAYKAFLRRQMSEY